MYYFSRTVNSRSPRPFRTVCVRVCVHDFVPGAKFWLLEHPRPPACLPPPTPFNARQRRTHARTVPVSVSVPVLWYERYTISRTAKKKGFSTVWKKHWSQHHLPPFSPLQFWQPTHTGWCRAKKEKKPRRKSGYRKAPIGPLVLPCAYVCVCVFLCAREKERGACVRSCKLLHDITGVSVSALAAAAPLSCVCVSVCVCVCFVCVIYHPCYDVGWAVKGWNTTGIAGKEQLQPPCLGRDGGEKEGW